MDKDLIKIGKLYGTDKLEHGYLQIYQEHLPDKVEKLLEIGCFKGASLMMWREYLNCEVSTLDLFEDKDNMSEDIARSFGFKTYKGDQSNAGVLESISEKFDVIIDDGSHRADHMWISMQKLLLHNLKPGGYYVVEDLHCCYEEFYRGAVKGFKHTVSGTFITYNITGRLIDSFLPNETLKLIEDRIESIYLKHKLLIIKTKV